MNSIQDEIIQQAADNMAKEIDREILWGFLESNGWVRVIIPLNSATMFRDDITGWLDQNCKNPYETNGRDYLFKEQQDANWFVMRWLS